MIERPRRFAGELQTQENRNYFGSAAGHKDIGLSFNGAATGLAREENCIQ